MNDIKKKKISNNTADAMTRYIVDSIAKNPLAFIPVIQTMLSPDNPDSDRLHQMIAESICKALVSKNDFKNICLERIVENIQQCTDKEIFKIVNDQRVALESDSKEFIRNIQEKTTVTLCEKYFNTQKKKLDSIFEDYFKEITKSIKSHIDALDAKTQDVIIKASDKNSVSIQVPNHMKNKVVEYMKFLQTQD